MPNLLSCLSGVRKFLTGTKDARAAFSSAQDLAEARYLVELADLRQREKALIERAVDVVCTIDSQGNFVFVSPSCRNAWGYAAGEVQGQSTKLLVGDDGFRRIIACAAEADKSIEKVIFETDIRCKDGSVKHVAWSGQWSISEKTLFCIIHDMTEQKQIEQALRSSEKQLKEILEFLPAGVLIMTKSGTVEFANYTAREMLEKNSTEIVGQKVDTIFTADFPSEVPKLSTNDRISMRSNGSTLPVETHIESIELGGQSKQLLLFVDKRSHYDFERTKQDFFAMVAHDLRAPLTCLRNLVVLIEEGILDKQSGEVTVVSKQVNHECTQLLRLVQDMVDIGKLGTNTFSLDSEKRSAAQVLQSAVEGVRFIAEKNNITISQSQTDSAYWGDELRVNQVLTNLLTNAIKHSSTNSKVEVLVSELAKDDYLRFAVKDSGPGIPADKLDRVFEIYEQLPGASGRPMLGTGLGLAICKMIVQRHGGQIGVESEPDQGSLFWFTIPRSQRSMARSAS